MSQLMSKQHPVCASNTPLNSGDVRVQLFSSCELHHAAFKYLLSAEGGFVLECATHAFPVDLKSFNQSRPDLTIIDMVFWPEGLLMRQHDILAALCRLTSVILLVDQIDTLTMRAMMACGVHGYVLTSTSLNELSQMLQVVLTGGRWLGQVTTHITPSPTGASYAVAGNPVMRDLSQRELEILKSVASGKTSKEIANALCLSESSVRTYWYRVLTKLNALNKIEAIMRAVRLGLLDVGSETEMIPLADRP